MRKRLLAVSAAGLAALLIPSLLRGQDQAPPAPPGQEESDTLGYVPNRTERMTVPVSIGGQGPYPFIVDTGAERTVISRELARELQLGPGRRTRMHSMTEVSDISTVLIGRLDVGRKRVRDIHAPALKRYNIGAEGILGIDTLRWQRVDFDFARQEMRISPSRRTMESWEEDTIVVTARSRLGYLVLVDASIDGQTVQAIVDTGSQVTVGNEALRRRLARRGKMGRITPITLVSVTGAMLKADQVRTDRMQLGEARINNMPIAFAEVHPFAKLGLTDQPAILLGMDVLRLFERVSVDFVNRRVTLEGGGRSALQTHARRARA